jgi:hypothetical protein
VFDEPVPDPPKSRSRVAAGLVIALSVLAVAGGIALLVIGVRAHGNADDAKAQTRALHRERVALEARTVRAAKDVDVPINDAERVAKSVTTIVEASERVIIQSTETNEVLDRAVGLANTGDREAAGELLSGDAAASVERLRATLAEAQAALAAAQVAAAELEAAAP